MYSDGVLWIMERPSFSFTVSVQQTKAGRERQKVVKAVLLLGLLNKDTRSYYSFCILHFIFHTFRRIYDTIYNFYIIYV